MLRHESRREAGGVRRACAVGERDVTTGALCEKGRRGALLLGMLSHSYTTKPTPTGKGESLGSAHFPLLLRQLMGRLREAARRVGRVRRGRCPDLSRHVAPLQVRLNSELYQSPAESGLLRIFSCLRKLEKCEKSDGEMPCKCCVPQCRGNYTVDTKVYVFKFPKDQTLRDAWIRAVPREDLSVTENSRDIIREASHTDESTGRTITVPLSHVRLRPDAVPSKFPSCPTYLSREATRREDPDSKRARMEHAAMQKAIAESEEMFNRAHEEDKVHSLGELIGHLRSKEMKFWNIIEKDERLVIIHIVDDEAPWLKYSVCVKGDMSKWDGDLISNSVEEICEAICLLLDQCPRPTQKTTPTPLDFCESK
ncbi:hypothetical protein HPB47_015863 [Ixodes persulcatus]|uniref:Uncharacterized protein n=1 Tax=Ixodes persulcatus TaxID=34615 RepID=A0AC60QUC7_IXOPE|nr:hypothetical protein HPB47_015863 [Ixodes persulcatus]